MKGKLKISEVDREIERDIKRSQRKIESDRLEELLKMVDLDGIADAMEHGCLVGRAVAEWIMKRGGVDWGSLSDSSRKEVLRKVLEIYKENRLQESVMSGYGGGEDGKDGFISVIPMDDGKR